MRVQAGGGIQDRRRRREGKVGGERRTRDGELGLAASPYLTVHADDSLEHVVCGGVRREAVVGHLAVPTVNRRGAGAGLGAALGVSEREGRAGQT